MKSFCLLLLCSIGLSSQVYSQIEKPEKHAFPGITNWEEVIAKATLDNKKIMVDLSTEWCYWCKVMDKQQVSSTSDAYNSALKEIKMNSHYLSPELKATFIKVMEKVANAYKPVTINEMLLIEKFKEDIAPINGDPVYYSK